MPLNTSTPPSFQTPAYMPLILGGKAIKVYGGPYFNKPDDMFGVKLAKEIDLPCEINLPIEDFSVPNKAETKKALSKALHALRAGEDIYVGCMGGKGRTGLFMALLAKMAGVKNPIQYVRASYNSHAVETPEQEAFVKNLNVFWLRAMYHLSSVEPATPKPTSFKPF